MWKQFKRLLSGQDHVVTQSQIKGHLNQLNYSLNLLEEHVNQLKDQVRIHNTALARIIAKIDPMYGRPEIDPQRRADSDAIAHSLWDKLTAEDKAARQTGAD